MVGPVAQEDHGRMRAHAASGFGGVRPAPRAVAAVLLAVLAGGCGAAEGDGDSSVTVTSAAPTTSTPSPTQSLVPPTDITAVGGVAVAVADADWVQVADGHVWTTLGTEVAVQLDPATGAEEVGAARWTGLTHGPGFDALWIAVCSNPGRVLRLDPTSGRVLASIAIPDDLEIMQEGSVASGEGFVWVVTVGDERTLVKIDPTSNTVVDRVPVDVGVTAARPAMAHSGLRTR